MAEFQSRTSRFLREVVAPAAIGAVAALALYQYQQVRSRSSLKVAFAGEMAAAVTAIRRPTHMAFEALERNTPLSNYDFYYPHAVYDGNVGRLGDLDNLLLVRDITKMYSMLEMAREEGRQLAAGKSDSEGMIRYTDYLCSAYGAAMEAQQYLPREESTQFDQGVVVNEIGFLRDCIEGLRAKLRSREGHKRK